MTENVKSSLRVLLAETIDYAGLFPPAQLSMAAAAQNYADYLGSEYAWMLGRFIVPADLLDEFAHFAQSYWNAANAKIWRISVLARENLAEAVQRIESFNQSHGGKAVVDTLEARADTAKQIKDANLPAGLTTYFEIPLAPQLPEQISALAAIRSRAKIRTGGVIQDAFPPVDELIKFLRVCVAANVPFKATAGLHHPLRTVKPLSYEPNAPTGAMHGFLNLFLATGFMRQNLNSSFIHRLVSDGDAKNFTFDDEGASWNGNRIELQQLKMMRERNAISFGSCSFVEPIEDLQQLGFL